MVTFIFLIFFMVLCWEVSELKSLDKSLQITKN